MNTQNRILAFALLSASTLAVTAPETAFALHAGGGKAFHDCVSASGVAMPDFPKPSPEEKSAMRACHKSVARSGDSKGDRAAFGECMSKAGFALPPPPQLTDEQRQVFESCRAKLGLDP